MATTTSSVGMVVSTEANHPSPQHRSAIKDGDEDRDDGCHDIGHNRLSNIVEVVVAGYEPLQPRSTPPLFSREREGEKICIIGAVLSLRHFFPASADAKEVGGNLACIGACRRWAVVV
ncbi:hypothetical protein CRG98_042659 [Punica granatum]|uniref:Uncharacterized protein n=1 Tax=Punica granatum TaxID=22663 RepID=A0A2I0HZ41_PUNGR|nr:hypothetical protein CRG98_042659 [Punica granatum]